MSLFRIKKQEDKIQKKVRNLAYLKENKKCFDCPTKSPFFVNTTNYTFICGRCSGLVREVGHRVKSIATSKFNGPEYLSLKYGGNCIARKVWLHDFPEDYEPQDHHQIRTFIHQKYREKRWLDKESLLSHTNQLKQIISLV
ncbi:hypothetical protein BDB01DRAFT_571014 [Pilobolus umbonatus]|nr:hypothetical protein BDB01DRAFT_571014 [Pilobolus umbonatus]